MILVGRGKVCKNPHSNISCLILDNVADNKDDDSEERIANKSIEDLSEEEFPPCVERMAFMSLFSYTTTKSHPYTFNSCYKHIKDTQFHNPPYSAAPIPFNWMLWENIEEKNINYDLNLDGQAEIIQRENCKLKSSWVNVYENQKKLLDCYFGQIKPKKSLCFFMQKKFHLLRNMGD